MRIGELIREHLDANLADDVLVSRVITHGRHKNEKRVVITQTAGLRNRAFSIACWDKSLEGAWELADSVEAQIDHWQPFGGAVHLQGREETWDEHAFYGIILEVNVVISE